MLFPATAPPSRSISWVRGPPVILLCGGSTDRMANAPLAALLASDFTVLNYDRRGRGDSGDTAPYAVERGVEDLDALVSAAGGSASVYGTYSGAALVLEAAATDSPSRSWRCGEPPFVSPGGPRPPADTAKTLTELVGAGRRGDAVEFFMAKVVGLPRDFVAGARAQPFWAAQEALAHTLAYDATVMGDYSLPTERVASVMAPTLVMDGGASFHRWERRRRLSRHPSRWSAPHTGRRAAQRGPCCHRSRGEGVLPGLTLPGQDE
jgi:alpha-beta hydrolase superfamily lysophospholipase